jgi:hypothetical protein
MKSITLTTLPACMLSIALLAAFITPLQSSAQVQRSVPADIGAFVALPGDPADGTGDNNVGTTLLAPLTITSGSPLRGYVGTLYDARCSIRELAVRDTGLIMRSFRKGDYTPKRIPTAKMRPMAFQDPPGILVE